MLEDLLKEIEQYNIDASEIADRHNKMKLSRFDIWLEELYEWLEISEEAWRQQIRWESLYKEYKQELERLKWDRRIELKAETDDNGKKKHTEATADAVIGREFKEEDDALNRLQESYKLIANIIKHIIEYINLVKMSMKLLTPLQWMPWD